MSQDDSELKFLRSVWLTTKVTFVFLLLFFSLFALALIPTQEKILLILCDVVIIFLVFFNSFTSKVRHGTKKYYLLTAIILLIVLVFLLMSPRINRALFFTGGEPPDEIATTEPRQVLPQESEPPRPAVVAPKLCTVKEERTVTTDKTQLFTESNNEYYGEVLEFSNFVKQDNGLLVGPCMTSFDIYNPNDFVVKANMTFTLYYKDRISFDTTHYVKTIITILPGEVYTYELPSERLHFCEIRNDTIRYFIYDENNEKVVPRTTRVTEKTYVEVQKECTE